MQPSETKTKRQAAMQLQGLSCGRMAARSLVPLLCVLREGKQLIQHLLCIICLLQGIRLRTVSCVDEVVGDLLYNDRCDKSKPLTEETCYGNGFCENHLPQMMGREEQEIERETSAWIVGDWSLVRALIIL